MISPFSKMGIDKNKSENRETGSADLIKAVRGAIIETPFNYSVVDMKNYTSGVSGMPLDTDNVSMTIRTTRLDLNFVKKDRIRLKGGEEMKVKSVSFDFTNERGQITGDIKTAYILTLGE